MESEELRRFAKKRKRPVTLTDLLNKEFLYEVFTEYIDRIIVIRDSKNRKIDLFLKPFLGDCGGKLPLTLPPVPDDLQLDENKCISIVKNEIIDFNNKELFREKLKEKLIHYFNYHENNTKIIGPDQTKNKQFHERFQKSKL